MNSTRPILTGIRGGGVRKVGRDLRPFQLLESKLSRKVGLLMVQTEIYLRRMGIRPHSHDPNYLLRAYRRAKRGRGGLRPYG